jgi:spore germination protein (amino acid permease)
MNNENIGHREALTLLIVVMSAKIFLSFPRNMAVLGEAAGWMIVLLSGILSLIGFYFIYFLIRKYPGNNIIEIARIICGPILGAILGLIFFLFFLIITSLFLRQFVESFILSILPRTPISVVTLTFLILLVYGCLLGIETISRVAWFYGPYLLTGLAVILLFSMFQANIQHLAPVLGAGPLPLLKSSLNNISLFSEILLFGLIAPLIANKTKIFGVGIYSIIFAIVINVIIVMTVVLVFNYVSAAKLIFPVFQLARLIVLEEFIQRVEAVFVFLWFFSAAIQLCALFYGTVTSFAQAFRIRDYRPLSIPIAVLVFTLSLIPTSMTQAVNINDFQISKYYSIVAFGIPLLLWLASLIIKKRSSEQKHD